MADRLTTVHLDDIHDSPDNLREQVGDVTDLAKSIAFIGLLEPLRVQKNGEGYKVIAGHRRLAALRKLHAEGQIDPETKVIIGDKLDDGERTAAMLIENMQRVDLSVKEEIEGIRRLVQDYGLSQAEVAENLGVTKQWVQDRVAMLVLDEEILTAPQHSRTDKPLPIASLTMLAKLPDDVRERLTKDGKVPTQYDIEDRTNQVAAKNRAAKELAAAVKRGVIAVTEKQLKRIVKSEVSDLDGVDLLAKTLTGNVTKISEYMYSQAKEPTIVLRQANSKVEDMPLDKIMVLKESGYPKWYTALVEGARADEDAELDEYEQICDEIDVRNEAKLAAWKDEKFDVTCRYVRDTKAAQLTADVCHLLIRQQLEGWRGYDYALDAARLLDTTVIDIPPQQEGETDDVYRQRVKDTKEEQIQAVFDYARKNGTQMMRTLAAFHAQALAELPPHPELEDYPESDEEGDDLDGF